MQSRYYDPEIGRFINADDVAYLGADGTLLSYNLFSYCASNPIMGYDPTGTINWGNVFKAAAVVLAVTAVVAVTVATAGAAAVAAGVISSTVATAATTGAVVGGLAAGTSEIAVQYFTKGPDNLNYGSIAIEIFIGSASGAIDGTASTLASAGGRLACKGAKVVLSGIGSVSHSINQGKTITETVTAAARSIGTSIVVQGGLVGKDAMAGKMSTTMLEQNLLDGAMTYGSKQWGITSGIRIASNIFRNIREIMDTVF